MISFTLRKNFGLTEPVTLIAHLDSRDEYCNYSSQDYRFYGKGNEVVKHMRKNFKNYATVQELFKVSIESRLLERKAYKTCYWLTETFLTHHLQEAHPLTLLKRLKNASSRYQAAFTYTSINKEDNKPLKRLAFEYIDFIDEKRGVIFTKTGERGGSLKTYKIDRISCFEEEARQLVVRYSFTPLPNGKTKVDISHSKELDPEETPWKSGVPIENVVHEITPEFEVKDTLVDKSEKVTSKNLIQSIGSFMSSSDRAQGAIKQPLGEVVKVSTVKEYERHQRGDQIVMTMRNGQTLLLKVEDILGKTK